MLAEEKTPKTKAVYPPLRTPNLPDWLNFDRQVCLNKILLFFCFIVPF